MPRPGAHVARGARCPWFNPPMSSPGNGDQPPARDDHDEDAGLVRHLLTSTFANYAGQIVILLVWFFLTPFILDRIGATQYGLWVLVASFLAYGKLFDIGVNDAIVKYVAEHRARGDSETASSLIATALWIYAALGAVVLVLGVALAPVLVGAFNVPDFEFDTAVWLVRITALGLAIELPAGAAFAVLQGLHRFDLMNLIGSAAMLTLAAGTVVVLLLGGGVLGMAAITIPLTLLWQVPAILAIRRTAPDIRFGLRGARRENLRSVASFGTALFGLSLAGTVKTKTDEIVIGASLPVAAVAPYSIARRLSELPEMLTFQFAKVLMPLSSRLHAEGRSELLRGIFVNSSRLTLGVFLATGVPIIIFARALLLAWVGEPYAEDAIIVVILTCAGLAEVAMYPAVFMLQGMDRHRPLVVFAVASAALNLVLSVILVQSLGVKGVAIGTLVATGLEMLVVLPFALRANQVRLLPFAREALAPALLSALPATAILLGLRELIAPATLFAIALSSLVGVVVYAACFLAFPQARRERAMLRSAGARLGVWGGAA